MIYFYIWESNIENYHSQTVNILFVTNQFSDGPEIEGVRVTDKNEGIILGKPADDDTLSLFSEEDK